MLFLCHNLRASTQAEKPWYCLCEKKLFLIHVLDFNAIFANQDPLPTLRPGNFDLHTKMPEIRPCLSRGIQMFSLCRFTSRRQAE